MKLEFTAFWDGEELEIRGLDFLKEQLRSDFQPGFLDGRLEHPFEWRTSEQFGYLFGEVAIKAMQGLRDAGYQVPDKYAALKFLMEHPDIACVDVVVSPFGDVVSQSAKSLSTLSRRDVYDLTKKLILLIMETFGIEIQSPDDFKTLMSVKKSR